MLSPIANLIFLIIFGYLLGSIPWGYLISKAKRIDIRKVGSGNIGGTNVLRILGFKWAALVSILDVIKGVIPAYLAINFLVSDWQIALVAISPILGHIFPAWLKFKGGKGVATTFGVLFLLLGWKFFLILLLIWLLVLAIFKIMSFTNLLMASFFPLILWLSSFSLAYYIFGIILAILIWWTHRENLQRIKEGRESKFKLEKTLSQT
ncbi:MAG: glycerol-3-phosphate 1-O-acyltransferase PlsY [Candidatus Nealsonbacteria bacterium]|nr:MAG: glycerol-3-phosphate 1-O-acyltransferase PlsY [Candidatus Nealsonbacteria bacterium]